MGWRDSSSAIAAEAGQYGIRFGSIEAGGRRSPRWFIHCGTCETEVAKGWNAETSPDLMIGNMHRAGWKLQRNRPPICPTCLHPPRSNDNMTTEKKSPGIGPDPKIARRVFALLDEHFDEGTRLYRSGYTDKRIAEEVGTSEELVARTRVAAYGELAEDPIVTGLKDDIQLLRMELDDVRAASIKAHDAMAQKIAAMEEKLVRARVLAHKAAG